MSAPIFHLADFGSATIDTLTADPAMALVLTIGALALASRLAYLARVRIVIRPRVR